MMTKPLTIYLAGPMDQVSKQVSISWRRRTWVFFRNYIKDGYVRILDPCRRPHNCNLNNREVVLLDLKDVRASDLLLVDIRWMARENTGTSSEIYEASQNLRIPVIGWYDGKTQDKSRTRLFMDEMVTRQFDSLKESIEHIEEYYLDRDANVYPY